MFWTVSGSLFLFFSSAFQIAVINNSEHIMVLDILYDINKKERKKKYKYM